jgi:hypothetical protein
MALRDLGPHEAELTWSASFQPDGLPASAAVDLLEGALVANCLAPKQSPPAAQPSHRQHALPAI